MSIFTLSFQVMEKTRVLCTKETLQCCVQCATNTCVQSPFLTQTETGEYYKGMGLNGP